MNFKKIIFVIFLASFSLEAPAIEKIIVAVGIAAKINIFDKIKTPFERDTGITLELREASAVDSILDLLDGKVDLAVNSISMPLIEKGIQKKHPEMTKLPTLVRSIIGRDRARIILNKDVQIAELSDVQVRILTCSDEKSWKALGGPDVPIKFVKSVASTGTFWESEVCKDKKLRIQSHEVQSINQVADFLEKEKGYYGIVPEGVKTGEKLFFPKQPNFGRPVQAFTISSPSKSVLRLYEFLRKDAKKYTE